MKDVLDIGELVLTAAGRVTHSASNLSRGVHDDGHEE